MNYEKKRGNVLHDKDVQYLHSLRQVCVPGSQYHTDPCSLNEAMVQACNCSSA